ncbi:MAG: hypothetical protein ACOCVL_02115 [Candidatus Sumerlaeota bacterium]
MAEDKNNAHQYPNGTYPRGSWPARIFFIALLLVFVGTAVYFQRDRSRYIDQNPIYVDDMFMPQAKYAKVLAFGFDHLMADLLYLRGIQAFGARFKIAEEQYGSTYQFFHTITELDPYFMEAYEFGSMVMNEGNNYEAGIRLNAKGFYKQPDKYRLAYLNTYAANWQLDNPDYAKVWLQKALSAEDSPDWLERWGPWLDTKMGRYDIGIEGRIRNYLDTYDNENRSLETQISLDNLQRTTHEWNLAIIKEEMKRYLEEHKELPESLQAMADQEGYFDSYRACHYPTLRFNLMSLEQFGVDKEKKALEIFEKSVGDLSGVPVSPYDDPATPQVEDYYVIRRDIPEEYYDQALENDALVMALQKGMREATERELYRMRIMGIKPFYEENERFPDSIEELLEFMGNPNAGTALQGDPMGNPWDYDPETGTVRSTTFPNL